MTLSKSKLGLSVSFFLVFTIGCLVGLMASSYLYYRHVFSKMANENAVNLGWGINRLCELRLGEVDAAIKHLERNIDNNIVTVALTLNIPETDYRHRMLRAAKTYREIYPSKSEMASKVTDALKGIPKIDTFKCNNPLCRLVKLATADKDQ
jgi:hypothetical protein